MVGIKLLLLSSFLFFFQATRVYCVYNKLTYGTSFMANQVNSGAFLWTGFLKLLEKDAKECCPYTTKDCSFNRVNYEIALFSIHFFFTKESRPDKYVKCTTGGGLTIYGTKENYYAECVDVSGRSIKVQFQDNKEPFDPSSVLLD